MSTKREHFTRHELHTNGAGKDCITTPSATKIMEIFTTRQPQLPIFLKWMAEINEESRKERSVEEGRNRWKKVVIVMARVKKVV